MDTFDRIRTWHLATTLVVILAFVTAMALVFEQSSAQGDDILTKNKDGGFKQQAAVCASGKSHSNRSAAFQNLLKIFVLGVEVRV